MKKIIYTMVVAAIALTSCTTGEPDVQPVNDDKLVQANFSSVISKATESEFSVGDQIGIYALASGKLLSDPSGIYNGYANFKYRAVDAKNFQPADETFKMYFPVDVKQSLDFVAYYPYSDGVVTAGNKLSVSVKDQNIATNQSLLSMYSDNAKGLNKESTSVPLNFRFMMSKLVLTLEKGLAISEEQLVGVSLQVKNASTTALVSLIDLTVGNYAGETEVIEGLVSDENRKIELYLLPHQGNTGIVLEFTDMAGNKYYYAIPDSHNFEPSKRYNYSLTMNKTIVQPVATIEDWLPGEDRNGNGDQQ